MGNRHHFVPRFYLGAFESDPRRIHVYNLRRNKVILGASLRDQCYARRLYGSNDAVESTLAQFEGLAAPVFKAMRLRGVLPGGGTEDRQALMAFLGLQLARTITAQENTLRAVKLLADVAFEGTPPEGYRMTAKEAMELTLAAAPAMASTIRDLSATLIKATRGAAFVTSDNPAVRYNFYCEGITSFGVTGTQCRGLQLFLPVSPEYLLYLFDPVAYKLVRPQGSVAEAVVADVAALNRLQLVSAGDNVYFHQTTVGPPLMEALPEIRAIRDSQRPRLIQAREQGKEGSRLLHEFWPMPQLDLRLTFVRIRNAAQQVPLFERARLLRRPYSHVQQADNSKLAARRFKVISDH